MKTITRLWILIAVLIALAPLGLIMPKLFKAGAAWGEWGIDEIEKLAGYVPRGLADISSLWKAPMSGYAPSYIMSAAAGVLATVGIAYLIGVFLSKKDRN